MWKKKVKEGLVTSFIPEESPCFREKMVGGMILVKEGETVAETMKALIRAAANTDHIATLWITDAQGRWVAALDLKALICARKGDDLTQYYRRTVPFVYEDETISERLEYLRESEEELIPVLDRDNRPVGIVSGEMISQFWEEEMREDYDRFAALSPDQEEGFFPSLRKRLPWLVTLLFLGLFVSYAVGRFEGLVAQIPAIVAFQSLILGMAGNAGTQSLAVTVRGLSDSQKRTGKRILREAKLGFCIGLILGILSFATVFLSLWAGGEYPLSFLFNCALSVFFAIWLAMMISTLLGTAIPLVLDRLGFDPAVASGPLITTLNDLVAVLSYYGLATLFLSPLTP